MPQGRHGSELIGTRTSWQEGPGTESDMGFYMCKKLKKNKQKKTLHTIQTAWLSVPSVMILGFIMQWGHLSPDPAKVCAVVEWPPPANSYSASSALWNSIITPSRSWSLSPGSFEPKTFPLVTWGRGSVLPSQVPFYLRAYLISSGSQLAVCHWGGCFWPWSRHGPVPVRSNRQEAPSLCFSSAIGNREQPSCYLSRSGGTGGGAVPASLHHVDRP